MSLIAVYGTLRNGKDNHHYIKNAGARFLGTDSIKGFTVFDFGLFPMGKISSERKTEVEIYDVDEWGLREIDELEGFLEHAPESGLFDRVQFSSKFGDVWVYIYNPDITKDVELWEVGI